jgi:hypothetical protein
VGPPRQREGEGNGIPFREGSVLGRGLPFGLGQLVAPRPFTFFCLFLFPFFDFLFVSKVKLFKTTSNQFKHKTNSFSQIQNNLLKQ